MAGEHGPGTSNEKCPSERQGRNTPLLTRRDQGRLLGGGGNVVGLERWAGLGHEEMGKGIPRRGNSKGKGQELLQNRLHWSERSGKIRNKK